MISVENYISLILSKKKWSITRFANEINIVKNKAGITYKTNKQNISNYLNNPKQHLGYKSLLIWEKALDMPEGSLSCMTEQPKTNKSRREAEMLKDKLRKI